MKWKRGTCIDIFNMLIDKRNWLVEFERIKSPIPKLWIKKLKCETNISKERKLLVNNVKLAIKHNKITRNNKENFLSKFKF